MNKLLLLILTSLTASCAAGKLGEEQVDHTNTKMIDHTSISVSSWDASLEFYDKTLEVLGYSRVMTFEEHYVAGYGIHGKPSFWISTEGNSEEQLGQARGVHFAFLAPDRAAVDEWYRVALECGATDNGPPGPRFYHADYYGAFVIDPDGWRIEAVCHAPEPQ